MQANLSIDDAVYREANAAAAREGITLREFIEEALQLKLGRAPMQNGETAIGDPTQPAAEEKEFRKRREDLAEFFAALKAKQATRQSEPEVERAELLEQLQTLVEQALERDRFKKGRFVPLTREEIYAERLDRFR